MADHAANIILASASPRRQELLARFNLPFKIHPSNDPEYIDTSLSPEMLVKELAKQKALSVAKKEKGLIIAADTIVAYQDQVLGKPSDREDAKRMLKMLSGNYHHVYTGLAICHSSSERLMIQSECTEVLFKNLSDAEIERYLASGEADDKAGAYGYQGLAAVFVSEIRGCYYNVVGFPLNLLNEMLHEFNYTLI